VTLIDLAAFLLASAVLLPAVSVAMAGAIDLYEWAAGPGESGPWT
jgi:nitrate reductase NapE component